MGKQGRTVIYKPLDEMVREVESLGDVSQTGMFIYALQWYCEPKDRIIPLVKAAIRVGVKKIQFEVFNLIPTETLAEMCKYVKPTFNLSPQSHDPEISKLAGRGTYTMEQMEDWIEKALPLGVDAINVWFMVGMPKQTTQSVFDTG
jgi:clorobiocin biosynthesis protein CloN6